MTCRAARASAWVWPWPEDWPQAIGARIDVDDTPGGGLTMVVILPLAENS